MYMCRSARTHARTHTHTHLSGDQNDSEELKEQFEGEASSLLVLPLLKWIHEMELESEAHLPLLITILQFLLSAPSTQHHTATTHITACMYTPH